MSREDIANKAWLNASSFRAILSVSLVLIVVVASLGFAYAYQLLEKYADDIAHKKVDASASDKTIASLQKVQQTIEQNQGLIDKIDTLRSNDTFPEFVIDKELRAIAKRNDIKVSSYTLGTSQDGATGGTTQPTPGQQPTVTAPISGGDTVTMTISFASVPSYKKYLQFLYDIEQNVPKMRIKGVGVSKSGGGDTSANGGGSTGQQSATSSDGVTIDSIVVEMYKR